MNELTSYAAEIRRHHEAGRAAAVTAIEHALAAGKLLTEARERIGHGGFEAWVTERCGFTTRTARRYMRLHAHRDSLPVGAGVRGALEHLKTDTVSEMTGRPPYLPALGAAAGTMDNAGAVWVVWEAQAGFAHAVKMPLAGDDYEAIWTKRPIRFDWLDSQLEQMGLRAANECDWRPMALPTALKLREIAAA